MIMKQVTSRYTLQFDSTEMNSVMNVIRSCQCNIIQSDAQLYSRMIVDVPVSREQEFLLKIERLYRVELSADA